MTPRIALLCADAGIAAQSPSGGGQALRGLARGLHDAGAAVELWSRRECPGSQEPAATLPGDVPLRSPPAGSDLSDEGFRSWCLREAERSRPEVVVERYALNQAVGAALRARLGCPWLLWIHAPLVWEARQFRGRRLGREAVVREEACWRSADARVAVSSGLAQHTAARLGPDFPVGVLPNGGPVPERSRPRPSHPLGGLSPARSVDPGRRGEGLPFVLGYEGSFRPWHGLLESLPALRSLQASVSPQPLILELWGDGPSRPAVVGGLRSMGLEVQWAGWGTDAQLAEARSRWSAAWIPEAPWPPVKDARGRPKAALRRLFAPACPPRYFHPLKEVAARNAGLPLWRGTGLPVASPLPPRSWTQVAAEFLDGPIRGMMQPASLGSANAS